MSAVPKRLTLTDGLLRFGRRSVAFGQTLHVSGAGSKGSRPVVRIHFTTPNDGGGTNCSPGFIP